MAAPYCHYYLNGVLAKGKKWKNKDWKKWVKIKVDIISDFLVAAETSMMAFVLY